MDEAKQRKLNNYIEDSLSASDYSDLEASVWSKVSRFKQRNKSVISLIFKLRWLKYAMITFMAFGITFGLILNKQQSYRQIDEQFSVVNDVMINNKQEKAMVSSEDNQTFADILLEKTYEMDNSYLLNELESLIIDIDRELEIINPNKDFSDFEL